MEIGWVLFIEKNIPDLSVTLVSESNDFVPRVRGTTTYTYKFFSKRQCQVGVKAIHGSPRLDVAYELNLCRLEMKEISSPAQGRYRLSECAHLENKMVTTPWYVTSGSRTLPSSRRIVQ